MIFSVNSKATRRACFAPSIGETLHLYAIKVQYIPDHSRIDESDSMRYHFEPGDRSKEQL